MQELVKRVEEAVRKEMAKQDAAHDWHHINRVRNTALYLAEKEGGDKLLVELAALVHDVGDRKAHESEDAGHKATFALLERCGVSKELADQVAAIAHNVSFKGFGVPDTMTAPEGKIVQDADRLDAVGAIAIARTFAWGGAKERAIHDPEQPIFLAKNAEEYYGAGQSSINHFHEKLLHLKDRMHTATAKKIAQKRHEFMEEYLRQFEHEWDAQDFQ